jgi:hypothetical protein
MMRTAGVSSLIAAAFLAACDDESPRAAESGTPGGREMAPPMESAAAGRAPSTTATAAQPATSASAIEGAGAASTIGTWEGTYDAKKGSVVLPPKVKDKGRDKDDGKTATGQGTVTLSIDAEGALRGVAKGALGNGTITGTAEGVMIRASVNPDDPHAPHAMTGTLVGMLKEGVIRAELVVAGPDATLIRESAVELRRK